MCYLSIYLYIYLARWTKFAKFGHWSNEDSKDLRCASQGHVWSRCVMHVCQRPWLQVSLH